MAAGRPYPPGVLKRLQDAETEILLVVDNVCRENGIDYFLMAGNLLGAVRHGGFIPWDDDTDIGMAWEDYCKFIEIAPKALPEGYSLHTMENTPGFAPLWVKVYKDGTRFVDEIADEAGCDQGIFLDVLPFRRLNADEAAAWKQCKRGIFWQRMAYLHFLAHPNVPAKTSMRALKVFACKVAHYTVARAYSPATIKRKWEGVFDIPESQQGSNWMNASYTYNKLLGEDVIFPTKDMEYDGHIVRGPNNPDAFLRSEYKGDYMQYPPMEDRYTHLPLVLDFGDGVNVMEGW